MAKSRPEVIAKRIEEILSDYQDKRPEYETAASRLIEDLANDAPLQNFIHSIKHRAKDPDHLKDKLQRKAEQLSLERKPFSITKDNYEKHIEDLAGCRLLHIHTSQIKGIHPRIEEVLKHYRYAIIGDPVSYTWDIENKRLFEELGLKVVQRDNFYTSTHYIIESPGYPFKCELQVRTLSEELWGEVSHVINYPHATNSISCREQLLALARLSSGCSRLVDSLFASKEEYGLLTDESKKD